MPPGPKLSTVDQPISRWIRLGDSVILVTAARRLQGSHGWKGGRGCIAGDDIGVAGGVDGDERGGAIIALAAEIGTVEIRALPAGFSLATKASFPSALVDCAVATIGNPEDTVQPVT